MGYMLQPPLLLGLLFGRSLSSVFLDQFRTRFQRDSVGTFKHPPCQPNIHATKLWFSWFGFFGFGEYLQEFLLEHQSFSFRFITGQGNPPVAQSSFLASLMTIAAGVAVYNDVFRRFCDPCFHWVAYSRAQIDYLVEPSNWQVVHVKPGPPRIHSFCVARLHVACRFPHLRTQNIHLPTRAKILRICSSIGG